MVADEENYLEQHNKRGAEKVKELRPDDNSEVLIKWIFPAIIIVFFSLLAIVGLIVGSIMFTLVMIVSTVLLVAFIRIFEGYCLKKSRPYLVMKERIEIPEKYTPSGEREKVKYKDITFSQIISIYYLQGHHHVLVFLWFTFCYHVHYLDLSFPRPYRSSEFFIRYYFEQYGLLFNSFAVEQQRNMETNWYY